MHYAQWNVMYIQVSETLLPGTDHGLGPRVTNGATLGSSSIDTIPPRQAILRSSLEFIVHEYTRNGTLQTSVNTLIILPFMFPS